MLPLSEIPKTGPSPHAEDRRNQADGAGASLGLRNKGDHQQVNLGRKDPRELTCLQDDTQNSKGIVIKEAQLPRVKAVST